MQFKNSNPCELRQQDLQPTHIKQSNIHGGGWDQRAKSEYCDVVTHLVHFWDLRRGLSFWRFLKVNKSEVVHNEAHSTSATCRAPSTNTTASMVGGATKRPRLDPVMPVTSLYTLWNLPSSLLLAITMGREACNWHNRVQPNVGDAISSEIGKLGHGICKRRRCRTGLELLVKATKSRFVRNDRPPDPDLVARGYRFPHISERVQLLPLAGKARIGKSVTSTSVHRVAGGNSDNVWASESIDWPSTQLWKSIGIPMSYIGTRPASRQLPHQIQVMEAACLHFKFFTFFTVTRVNEWHHGSC